MGCADPPSKKVGAPHQFSRVNEKRSGCVIDASSVSLAATSASANDSNPIEAKYSRGVPSTAGGLPRLPAVSVSICVSPR